MANVFIDRLMVKKVFLEKRVKFEIMLFSCESVFEIVLVVIDTALHDFWSKKGFLGAKIRQFIMFILLETIQRSQ